MRRVAPIRDDPSRDGRQKGQEIEALWRHAGLPGGERKAQSPTTGVGNGMGLGAEAARAWTSGGGLPRHPPWAEVSRDGSPFGAVLCSTQKFEDTTYHPKMHCRVGSIWAPEILAERTHFSGNYGQDPTVTPAWRYRETVRTSPTEEGHHGSGHQLCDSSARRFAPKAKRLHAAGFPRLGNRSSFGASSARRRRVYPGVRDGNHAQAAL